MCVYVQLPTLHTVVYLLSVYLDLSTNLTRPIVQSMSNEQLELLLIYSLHN